MAGKKGWVLDEGGKEHPEKSDLLAYNRGQQLEDTFNIHQHISQCPRCLDMSRKFEDASEVLGTLEQMQQHLDYPDVPPERVFNRFQSEAARYERRLSTRLVRRLEPVQRRYLHYARYLKPKWQLSSVNAYSGLILVLILAVLTFSVVLAAIGVWHDGVFPINIAQPSMTQVSRPNSVSVQQHHMTPTVNQGGQGSTTGSGARIRDCTNGQDRNQSQLRICGSDFKPGDKVALLVTISWSGQPKQRRTATVDGHGKFFVLIPINKCNVPVALVAHDLNTNAYSNTLQDIKFGGCRVPSPNVGSTGRNR